MLRFYYVIIVCIGFIIYYVPKMHYYTAHRDKYSDRDCYLLAQKMMRIVAKMARVSTDVYGTENLPREGGYTMFSNHQGKYDALGIMNGHERNCKVLMDMHRSKMPIADSFISLICGTRLDRSNIRQQVQCIHEIADEVKNGEIYLIFPEGGYAKDQTNEMGIFRTGCFKAATLSQCPVVPVAIVDSYKPFGVNSLKKVKTKVYFLPPIAYEEFENMSYGELCRMVQGRIKDQIERSLRGDNSFINYTSNDEFAS